MTLWQGIVSIIVALIAGVGGTLTFVQFLIKRKDDKEKENIELKISDAVKVAKEELYKEIAKASEERSQEGADRFKIHAESIKHLYGQIDENTKQIGELTKISKDVLESMDSLRNVVKASAESQRNANYDRLLFIGKKVLKERQITISEKTNLKQLYDSYKELNGEDLYIDTLYDECMKLVPVPDDES